MRNDILIIGAGPSGLFAAAELARHGVAARLIEREVRPHREARATAIQPGTLEILETVGLLPPFLDAAEHVRCSRLYGPDMSELGATSYERLDCRFPFMCSLPQYATQRLLEAHLASLGGRVERGVTATQVETEADGVCVDLVHADGTAETVRPRVVIGAGGAHSVTRHSMSEPLEGATYQGHFLVADIAMPAPSAVRMACCCSRRSRAGAGSVSRTWKRTWRPYPPQKSSPGSRHGSAGNIDPPTSPGSRRFGCTGGSSRAWRTAGDS